MVSIRLEAWTVGKYNMNSCVGLLKRLQHMHALRRVLIQGDTCDSFHSLFPYLPEQLTTLALSGEVDDVNLQQLGRLKCLKTLQLYVTGCKVTGLEHLSGLTRLETNS